MPASFRHALEKRGLAVGNVRKIIQTAKMVYRWGEEQELLTRNKIALYRFKVAKEKRAKSPGEYRGDEFARILAALDPRKGTQWKAWCAIALCGYQGARSRSVLHLAVADIRLGGATIADDGAVGWRFGRVHWRPEYDKNGEDWSQPLRPLAQVAVEIALEWRERTGYTGPWLLPAGSSLNPNGVYSKKSLWLALRGAEQRAGIEHRAFRAAHGLRRMLAGDVTQATGDPVLGLRAIGDRDLNMAKRYIQDRQDRTEEAFTALDAALFAGAAARDEGER